MGFWSFDRSQIDKQPFESKMADHREFGNRLRKTLYYGDYSDASVPSMSVTDVAVEVLNSAVPPKRRHLDRKYAHGVARRANFSPCTLMMGMLYSERLRQQNAPSTKELSSSDIFLISIMVASKYLYDEGEEEEVFNDDWAKAGLKTVHDINKLEMEFLDLMDWDLFISPQEFLNFVNKVESQIAARKGCARGWLTYSDLETLLNNQKLQEMISTCTCEALKIISACIAAYLLSISLLVSTSTLVCLKSQPPQDPNLTNAVHPTVNCLTSEALCRFSRYDLVTPPGSTGNCLPIACRRQRNRNYSPLSVENKESVPTAIGGGSLQSKHDTRNRISWFPPIAYHLERAQGTSISLPAFANFTVSFEYLRHLGKTSNSGIRSSQHEGSKQNGGILRDSKDRLQKSNNTDTLLNNSSTSRTGFSAMPKCLKRQSVCIA